MYPRVPTLPWTCSPSFSLTARPRSEMRMWPFRNKKKYLIQQILFFFQLGCSRRLDFLPPLHAKKRSFYFEAVRDRKETLKRLHIFQSPRGNYSCQLSATPLFSGVSKNTITLTVLPCQHYSSNYVPELLARLTIYVMFWAKNRLTARFYPAAITQTTYRCHPAECCLASDPWKKEKKGGFWAELMEYEPPNWRLTLKKIKETDLYKMASRWRCMSPQQTWAA